jgi:trehalose 2-sulfotransferase
MKQKIYYIICTTSRSGSNLLCNLLENTGIAGKNISERCYRNILESIDWEKKDLKKFFEEMFEESRKGNVSGFKIMWAHIECIIEVISRSKRYKNISVYDIPKFLPKDIKYIWLVRKNKIRQAISFDKCKQGKIFKIKKDSKIRQKEYPIFRIENIIHGQVSLMNDDLQWEKFFKKNKIKPLKREYEEFSINFKETIITILKYLGITIPKKLIVKTDLLKQSNNMTEEWINKYYQTSRFIRISYYLKWKIIRSIYNICLRLKLYNITKNYQRFIKNEKNNN